jgi:predicted RNA methylase
MIELQRKLLGDTIRNQAFYDALKATVKPGMEVLDLGSGTGFLAFLASRLGAGHITCVEVGDILKVSKQLANRNSIKNCTFIHKHSTELKNSNVPKADILVSETLGNYALEENIIESVEDAKRFLKPNATVIPGKIFQYVCPVTSPRIHKDIDVFDVGFDVYVYALLQDDLLPGVNATRKWDTVDFSKKNASTRRGTETWKIDEPATVYGLALWWEAELTPGVMLSTAPAAPLTHWQQIYLPLLKPVKMEEGSSLSVHLVSDTRWQVKVDLTWNAKVMDAAGKIISEQVMEMKKGHLN